MGYYDATTGAFVGLVPLPNIAGLPGKPQAPVASPWVYTTGETGNLVIDSGLVEFFRDNASGWITVSQQGGSVAMLKNDSVRVTWYNSIPKIIFFPTT